MKRISALKLEQWAEKLNARTDFPAVVLDLVRASATSLSSYRFPQGDKGQVRGFDGIVECEEGNAFVPDGLSIWEIGHDKDYEGKANYEYQKHTDGLTQEARGEMTLLLMKQGGCHG
ncbi:hypothetical protein [Duganella sp. BuS-21]|uniref:hypothetical protein n=1 Tax=Duganella sp. BuS-21 TaxID=2943848 RepID=UPI0035A65B93